MEIRVVRTTLGPIIANEQQCGSRTNEEIKQWLQINIITKIMQCKVRWLGPVWSAKNQEPLHSLFQWDPGGKRRSDRRRNERLK